MKKLFSVHPASKATDLALLIARVAITALMLTHGLPKIAMLFSGEPVQFPGLFGMSPSLTLGLAVITEVVGSFFVLVGLGTRLAVLSLFVTMLVAAIHVHAADPFAVKEVSLLYSVVYAVLLFAGSGRYSIDYLLQRGATRSAYNTTPARRSAFSSLR